MEVLRSHTWLLSLEEEEELKVAKSSPSLWKNLVGVRGMMYLAYVGVLFIDCGKTNFIMIGPRHCRVRVYLRIGLS